MGSTIMATAADKNSIHYTKGYAADAWGRFRKNRSSVVAAVIILALLLFVTGDHHNGGIFLLLAFLISPYGLPMIAEWLWKRLADVRGVMWRFVFG